MLSNPLLATPQLLTGFGVDAGIDVDDAENLIAEKGIDGGTNAYFVPVILSGKMTFLPNSPALTVIRQIQAYSSRLQPAFVLVGSLIVQNSSLGSVVTYPNFMITNPFKGFEQEKKVKDVVVSFKCDIPQSDIVGDIVTIAANILNQLGR
jgi:hypothetical protein